MCKLCIQQKVSEMFCCSVRYLSRGNLTYIKLNSCDMFESNISVQKWHIFCFVDNKITTENNSSLP